MSLLLLRDTDDHIIYIVGGQYFPVPRHVEINEWTVMWIMKDLEDELGKWWWKWVARESSWRLSVDTSHGG